MKNWIKISCGVVALAMLSPVMGQEAEWPTKAITAVVPFAPGSSADAAGRIITEEMAKVLGKPIVVENKSGAGGTIGSEAVAKSAADGYTILIHSNSHVIAGFTYQNLRFSPEKDLVGVSPVASIYHVFVSSADKPYKDLTQLAEVAKNDPDALNYASAGTGSITHLGAEKLLSAGGVKATHIPFKATSEALTEVMAGRVDFFLSPIGLIKPHVEAGKIRVLGISDAKRAPDFPEIKTVSEQGFNNAETPGWVGIFAPAGVPSAVLEKLNKAANEALNNEEVRTRLASLSLTPMLMDVGAFNSFLEQEFRANEQLVKSVGLSH